MYVHYVHNPRHKPNHNQLHTTVLLKDGHSMTQRQLATQKQTQHPMSSPACSMSTNGASVLCFHFKGQSWFSLSQCGWGLGCGTSHFPFCPAQIQSEVKHDWIGTRLQQRPGRGWNGGNLILRRFLWIKRSGGQGVFEHQSERTLLP